MAGVAGVKVLEVVEFYQGVLKFCGVLNFKKAVRQPQNSVSHVPFVKPHNVDCRAAANNLGIGVGRQFGDGAQGAEGLGEEQAVFVLVRRPAIEAFQFPDGQQQVFHAPGHEIIVHEIEVRCVVAPNRGHHGFVCAVVDGIAEAGFWPLS